MDLDGGRKPRDVVVDGEVETTLLRGVGRLLEQSTLVISYDASIDSELILHRRRRGRVGGGRLVGALSPDRNRLE